MRSRSTRGATPDDRRCSTSCWRTSRYVPGTFDDDDASTSSSAETLDEFDERGRASRFDRVLLPLDGARVLPGDRRPARRARAATSTTDAEVRVVIEKPFGDDARRRPRSSTSDVLDGLRRAAGLPHRPLPGQGDRPEHAGVPLRQRHVRADLEPQLHRPRPDHRRRGPRASARAPATTTAPARCATWSRTTCSSCCATSRMEPPVNFSADEVRNEKVKVLHAIHAPTAETVPTMAVRAQYAGGPRPAARTSRGYLRGGRTFPPDSNTETYAALRLEVDNWRWAGVPVLPAHRQAPGAQGHRDRGDAEAGAAPRLPAGGLGRRPAQPAHPDRCSPTRACRCRSAAKIPGTRMRIRPVNMEFLYGTSFLSQSPEAYERLIMDAMRGDATLFTRNDEVEAQWRICDPIVETLGGARRAAAAVRGRARRGPRRPTRCSTAATGDGLAARSDARRLGQRLAAQDTTPGEDRGGAARAAHRAPLRERALRRRRGCSTWSASSTRSGAARSPTACERRAATTRRARSSARSSPGARRSTRWRRSPPTTQPERGRSRARCARRSSLDVGAQAPDAPRPIVDPLVVTDLPTVRLVAARAPRGGRRAAARSPRSSCSTRSTSPTCATALDARSELREQAYVVDLAWLRSTPWRERVAATFDPDHLRARAAARSAP